MADDEGQCALRIRKSLPIILYDILRRRRFDLNQRALTSGRLNENKIRIRLHPTKRANTLPAEAMEDQVSEKLEIILVKRADDSDEACFE